MQIVDYVVVEGPLEGCMDAGEMPFAGKVKVKMAEGYIPHGQIVVSQTSDSLHPMGKMPCRFAQALIKVAQQERGRVLAPG